MAKNQAINPMSVITIIAILALVGVVIYFGNMQQQTTLTETKSGDPITNVDNCLSTTSPNVDFNTFDKDNTGTALTEGTNLVREKGDTLWTAFTAGTAFAANVGDELEVVLGISTSDFTDNAYGKYFTYTVPCEEEPDMDIAIANDEIETSVTATFFNADDDAGSETFIAGVPQTVSIKLSAGSDEYFGNPFLNTFEEQPIGGEGQRALYPNVIGLSLNATEWDKPEKVFLDDGTEMKSITCPQRLDTDATTSGFTEYCYELPVITDTEFKVKMRLDPDNSNAPSVDGIAYLYAANWYIHSEDSTLLWGVETDEDAAVGTDAADQVILDFTV